MQLLYDIGIRLMSAGIRIHSLFNPKSKSFVAGRKNVFDELPDFTGKKVIWFHCASLGEFDQGLPLMEIIKEKQPEVFLLVTFFSPSGYEHYQKRNHSVDYATYMPIDTKSNAKKFIAQVQPEAVFFIKYEFWVNHIHELKKRGAKIYNVSGLFRKNHRFFKWYGSIFRKSLAQFDHFYVQNAISKSLLESINIKNTTVTGDARFDQVIENRNKSTSDPLLEKFKNNQEVVVIGSSWPEDEKVILNWVNSGKVKVLIAPHDVSQKNIKQLSSRLSTPYSLYTEIDENTVSNVNVIILDNIGMLSNAYSIGVAAYVGGGFSGSLHNILEPAAFGLPVIFGPKHSRFPEAQNFIDASIGFSISNRFEFEQTMHYILKNQTSLSKDSMEFVEENKGTSKAIYESINW